MTHTIHKVQLEITDQQHVMLPANVEILTVQVQRGIPCVWYKFNKSVEEKVKWSFYTVGTGHNTSTTVGQYVGTYQIDNGNLVFHVFARRSDV